MPKRAFQFLSATFSPTALAVNTRLRSQIDEAARYLQPYFGRNATCHDLACEADQIIKNAHAHLNQSRLWKIFAIEHIQNKINEAYCNLCYILPASRLELLLEKLEYRLSDYDELAQAAPIRERVDDVRQRLSNLATKDGNPTATSPEVEQNVRDRLAALWATLGAHDSLAWHRSSLIRARAIMMLFVLIVLLVVAIPLVAYTTGDLSWFQVWAIQVMGAIGGALSALQTRSETPRSLPQYYVQDTILYLRPAVGAGAALGVALMLHADVLELFPSANGSENDSRNLAIYLFVGFLAGFSERFFVGRLEQIAAPMSPQG